MDDSVRDQQPDERIQAPRFSFMSSFKYPFESFNNRTYANAQDKDQNPLFV